LFYFGIIVKKKLLLYEYNYYNYYIHVFDVRKYKKKLIEPATAFYSPTLK